MKEMKKIFALVVVAITLFSCDKTESPLFDGERRIGYFDRASATLEVIIDENEEIVSNTVTVNVVSSETSTQDRTYQIGLVSSTIDASGFEFPETVTIPATTDPSNPIYTGSFTVTGFNIEELTTSNELLIFEILSTSDDADLNGSLRTIEMQMRLVCQIDSELFVGAYTITQISPDPAAGADVALAGTVNLQLVEGRSTSRQFEAVYLPLLGIGQPAANIIFDISCGEVIADDNLGTFLLCDQQADVITFGQAIGDNAFIEDTSDDSQFFLTMQEGQSDGGCGGYPFDATFLLTKN